MPARKSLKTADSKLRAIEDKVGAGTWTWDLETSEVTWSPGLCRILGVDTHTVVPSIDLYQSLVHPDDQMDFDDSIGIVSDRKLESRRFRIIRPDGVLRWLHSKAQPHFDRNGKTIMLTGVMQDVTEEEEMRESLSIQKDAAKLLTTLLGGWVWRAHPDGKLMETAHWMKLTGQTALEAHDWAKLDAIHPEDRQRFRDTWADAIKNRSQYEATIRVRSIDGAYFTLHSSALPLIDRRGKVLFWIGHSTPVIARTKRPEAVAVLDPVQIRASRAILDWTGPELAIRAGISFSTVRRMEQCAETVRVDSLFKVRAAFEAAGVNFSTDDNGEFAIGFKMPVSAGTNADAGAAADTDIDRSR